MVLLLELPHLRRGGVRRSPQLGHVALEEPDLLRCRALAHAPEHLVPVLNDPRITDVGGVLRKFRIDELPQLFNVLRGEMSLVGPRPERPVFVKKLAATVPFYSERLLVRPGITGWAQVMAPYAASVGDSMHKVQFDLYYTKHLSFSLDILILLKTAKTVLLGRERVQGGITAGEQLATTPVPLLLDGPHLVAPLGSVEAVAEGMAYSGTTTSDRKVAQA